MKLKSAWAFCAILFGSLLYTGGLSAQFGSGLKLESGSEDAEGPMIEFESTDINLGTFSQGETVVLDISFKSVGSDPLEVDRVKPSCSCSTLEWTEDAIPPGESGKLHAEIDTGEMMELGEKTKYFVFFYNGNPGVERVTVTFTLEAGPEQGKAEDADGDGLQDPENGG